MDKNNDDFDENHDGQRYLEFLGHKLMLVLTEMFPNTNYHALLIDNMWFQQDRAPPHFAFLEKTLEHVD